MPRITRRCTSALKQKNTVRIFHTDYASKLNLNCRRRHYLGRQPYIFTPWKVCFYFIREFFSQQQEKLLKQSLKVKASANNETPCSVELQV